MKLLKYQIRISVTPVPSNWDKVITEFYAPDLNFTFNNEGEFVGKRPEEAMQDVEKIDVTADLTDMMAVCQGIQCRDNLRKAFYDTMGRPI